MLIIFALNRENYKVQKNYALNREIYKVKKNYAHYTVAFSVVMLITIFISHVINISYLFQCNPLLLKPDGLAFDNYEIGEFFQELLKKFTQEKDEKGRKMEYLHRRQARNEDARQFYTDKLRLFVQAYPPARRSLVEFKTNILLGLYNAELRKTWLLFMPKDNKHEREIKAVLDHQLVSMRTYNLDPRAPAQDMAGLQSTYGYDKSDITKVNEMLKTGQVPMDVNAMPGLVEDVSYAKELDAESGINALQGGDACYFCKKPGHQKRDCRKFDERKRKNPNRKYGSDTHKASSPPPQFRVKTAGKRVIFQGNVEENGETREGERMADMEADRWRIWPNLWQQYRKF